MEIDRSSERADGPEPARPAPGEELNIGEATIAREAASLILLRDTAAGPEVLLVQRNPEQRFMGGAWVFPGGSTHGDDGDELATAIRELEEEAGIELPEGHELVRFSRWITPAQVKVRFDTHFFVAEAPEDAEPTVDGSECVAWRWVRPQQALDLHRDDELMLVFPTIKHLEQLARFGTVSETLETARASRVLPVEPRVLVHGGVAQVVLPGEPGYDD
jgi:8-oxo-dGTP pyrophosphatase MutT (NUDIX family)